MKILALNGGGTFGYASAIYLASLEQALKKPCHQAFDLITGVSTGAIQAVCLASGVPARTLVRLYETEIPKLFRKLPWWKFWKGYLAGPLYDRAALANMMKSALNIPMFGSVQQHCMVHATQLSPDFDAKFWKSWRRDDQTADPVAIVLASAAAPGFFGSYGYLHGVYADGGLVANNPAVPAIAEALKLGAKLDEIRVLNVAPTGTGAWSNKHARAQQSFARWAPCIANVMIDAEQNVSAYIAQQLLGARYVLANLNCGGAIDSWDATVKAQMEQSANVTWRETGDQVVAKFA